MKRKSILLYTLTALFILTSWKVADNIITRLGMQEQNARRYIINNFIGRFSTGPMEDGYEGGDPNSIYNQLQSFQIPTARLLKDIIGGDKSAAAKELCEYVKTYISSQEFSNEYNRLREDAMPLTDRGSTLADLRRNKEVCQKNIDNYKTDTKYVAEQQKLIEENQKKIDALIAASKKPFPGKEAWEKAYPADPAILVKKRLQEYLQVAATVDFNAKLTGEGKKKTFVNPVYEKKSLKWKAIYRSGKEVNDVVTAFIKEWLKGGIIPATKLQMDAPAVEPAKPTAGTTAPAPVTTSSTPETKPAAPVAEKQPEAKPKKSLLGKLKEKAGTVTGNQP